MRLIPRKTSTSGRAHARLSQIRRDQSGFISVVALGIFAVLVVFGIIIQLTTTNTYRSISNSNNYYAARDVSDSVMEYLQDFAENREAGFNTGKIACRFALEDDGMGGDPPNELCAPLAPLAQGMDLTVEFEIKGRAIDSNDANVNESLTSGICHEDPFGEVDADRCYVVPFPGSGNAGERCDLYEPDLGTLGNAVIDSFSLTGNAAEVDQLEYSCNWGKLQFGSSLSDRVVIPLYYDDGNEDDEGNPIIVNPFNSDDNLRPDVDQASAFYLRMRTPCKPCWYDQGANRAAEEGGNDVGENREGANNNEDPDIAVPDGFRSCFPNEDPTVCSDDDRFILGGLDDEVIVQWQISGTCEEGGCGVVGGEDPFNDELSSVIHNRSVAEGESRVIISNLKFAKNINSQLSIPIQDPLGARGFLNSVYSPTLSLFLNEKLISDQSKNIPYLEYQFISDHPVSNNQKVLQATVTVNNNVFRKSISIQNTTDLIDFAIQN
jgi:hypothetical protein